MIDLAAGAHIHDVFVRRHIGGLRRLGLVVELVGRERPHKVNGGRQGDCLAIIQPGIVILPFRFEIASTLAEPRCIVSRRMLGFREKTGQFPVSACLLQDESQRPRILTAVYIERGYAVIAGRQIGQDKFRAILRLTRLPKYSAQKFSACERFRAFSRQQKGWPNRCFCVGESGLVLFDRGFDSVKAGGHGGNGVLLQGSCIPARRHFEIAFRRGFERGSYGGIHVRGGLAGLGVGRTSQQTSEQSSEQCSQQQEPQPLSAVPSIPEREFRPNNRSNAQRESLRWHFTRSQSRGEFKCLQRLYLQWGCS